MVILYECSACQLRFFIGWFHYHQFETGYGSKSLLICRACGTQYAIEIAMRDRGEAYDQFYDVMLTSYAPDSKLSLMKVLRHIKGFTLKQVKEVVEHVPYCLAHEIPTWKLQEWKNTFDGMNVVVQYPVIKRTPNPEYGALMPDRFLGKECPVFSKEQDRQIPYVEIPVMEREHTPNEEILLDKLVCHYCHARGQIITAIQSDEPCPACHQSALVEKEGWVT